MTAATTAAATITTACVTIVADDFSPVFSCRFIGNPLRAARDCARKRSHISFISRKAAVEEGSDAVLVAVLANDTTRL